MTFWKRRTDAGVGGTLPIARTSGDDLDSKTLTLRRADLTSVRRLNRDLP
jgi:hypothetical protein